MIAWLGSLEWHAVAQIILIDVLLGGDNAVIIALACRNLSPRHRRLGILWGAAGAIALRVLLITVAVALLQVPLLKLVGGALLLWIGVKLLAPVNNGRTHDGLPAGDRLLAAVRTIIVADFVMSLDNVVAIAGAAEHADPSQRTGLVIFGLLVSVPFILYGSQLILKLLDRFPVIVTGGAALLGWIAGGLIVGDPALAAIWWPPTAAIHYAASAFGAVLVIAAARWLAHRRGAAGTLARH